MQSSSLKIAEISGFIQVQLTCFRRFFSVVVVGVTDEALHSVSVRERKNTKKSHELHEN